MAHIMLDVSIDEIKAMVLQLPPQELLALADVIEERAEVIGMMRLAETSFREWDAEGEDIYDAQT